MPGPTLSAAELAEEVGRPKGWLYDHWREMVKKQGLPPPLLDGTAPLTWSRAQVMAWLDRKLPPAERAAAAAFRAAVAAAAATTLTGNAAHEEDAWRRKLDLELIGKLDTSTLKPTPTGKTA